jgi:hypothetical protein
MISPYEQTIENQMVVFFESLSEKDKIRYATIEVLKLTYGGKSYIRDLLNCRFNTIDKGIKELKDAHFSDSRRVRKTGGGRKACIESIVGIDDLFLKVVNTPPAKDRWLQVTAESRIVSPKGDL